MYEQMRVGRILAASITTPPDKRQIRLGNVLRPFLVKLPDTTWAKRNRFPEINPICDMPAR